MSDNPVRIKQVDQSVNPARTFFTPNYNFPNVDAALTYLGIDGNLPRIMTNVSIVDANTEREILGDSDIRDRVIVR